MKSLDKQVTKECYLKFRINGRELDVLISLASYLTVFDKRACSLRILCAWLGAGYRMHGLIKLYVKGLEDRGFVHRLAYRRPTGQSLSLSPLGIRVLKYYETELTRLAKIHKVKNKDYETFALDPENLPRWYTLVKRGSD